MKPYEIISSDMAGEYLVKTLTCVSVDVPAAGLKPHKYQRRDAREGRYVDTYGYLRSVGFLGYTPGLPDPAIFDNLVLAHRNRIGTKALNLLDILRTRKESIDMISENAWKIARALSNLKRGRFKQAARSLGIDQPKKPRGLDVPSRWLELQYGWLPLLSDIYAIGNDIFRVPTFKVRTTFHDNVFNRTRVQSSEPYGYLDSTFECSDHYRHTLVTRFTVDSDFVTTMDNIGVLNPLLVAWEAVPFSFIVDWFIPVGDWLSSLSALNGLNLEPTSYTKTLHRDAKRLFTYHRSTSSGVKASGSATDTVRTKQRIIYTSIPLPLPRFTNPLSLTHFANALSLIAVNAK